jgi:hypothetical protein
MLHCNNILGPGNLADVAEVETIALCRGIQKSRPTPKAAQRSHGNQFFTVAKAISLCPFEVDFVSLYVKKQQGSAVYG